MSYYELLVEKQFTTMIILVLIVIILVLVLVFFRKNAKNKKAIFEANQRIYQLNKIVKQFDSKEKSVKNTLFQRFDILKKVALLEGFLRDEEKENGKDLLCKFNEIIYGQKEGLDWNLLYQSMNEMNNGFLDRIHQAYPQLDESEFRICCLAYDGFNNTEIAIIMKLSFNTIQVKKSMVRKKIGAHGHGNLIEFLDQNLNKD